MTPHFRGPSDFRKCALRPYGIRLSEDSGKVTMILLRYYKVIRAGERAAFPCGRRLSLRTKVKGKEVTGREAAELLSVISSGRRYEHEENSGRA